MKRLLISALLLLSATPVLARNYYFNYVQRGNATALISLSGATSKFQGSYPGATVRVDRCTTSTLATLYFDSTGTPKPNPFTASTSTGFFDFWSDLSCVKLTFSGGGLPNVVTIDNVSVGGGNGSSGMFNVKDYGAKGDLRTVTDGAISGGLLTLSSATATFTSADVGKQIQISGAGTAGATLYSTITSVTSPTVAILALGASTTVSGATVKIYTDDGVAIGLASTAIQSNGSGTLYFPPGTYGTYGKGTVYTLLGAFVGLNNLSLMCDGCTLYLSGEHTVAGSGAAFSINATNGVTIDGWNVVGELTLALAQSGTFHGMEAFRFVGGGAGGSTNINIPRARGTGLGLLVEFNNNLAGTYDGLPHSRGIHIGVIECTTCVYVLDAQYSMDDAVIDMLRSDGVLRSMFIYGSTNVTANIHSKDAAGDDVKLWCTAGQGMSNISIRYYSGAESTARSNSGALISPEFVGPTPCTIKNLSLTLDVTYPGSGTNNTGSAVVHFRKYNANGSFDTTDRGHILDGLVITGSIKNYPNDGGIAGIELPGTDSKWGPTLDSFYNVRITGLSLTNAKLIRVGGSVIRGPILIENFRSDQPFSTLAIYADTYQGAPDFGPPATGQYRIINSSYSNQYTIANGDRPSGVVYMVGDLTLGVGARGQRIVSTGCGSTCTATLPAAVVGLEYTFNRTTTVALRAAPQAADQIRGASAVNKYIQMDVAGEQITLTCTIAGLWDVRYFAATADVSFQP